MASGEPDESRVRVLLVDDSPEVRTMTRALLARDGWFVVVAEASDGQEAIDLSAAHQPDLVLLDALMPVVSGLDALPRIRDVAPEARIVMFSSASDLGQLGVEAGADAFVSKFSSSTLVARLSELFPAR